MKNIDRLAIYITKHGAESFIVHTIPKTTNWLICQKIEENKWSLSLCNPMGNVTYNLGTVTREQHLEIWRQLTELRIEEKTQLLLAKQLKTKQNLLAKELKKRLIP